MDASREKIKNIVPKSKTVVSAYAQYENTFSSDKK